MRRQLCGLFAGVAAVAAMSGSAGAATVPPASGPAAGLPEDSWKVAEVIDGDTLDIEHGGVVLRVRLIGVNAPESGECWAQEATEALAVLVSGGLVWLEADVSEYDDFGRLLRYVYNEAGDDVGELLIENGDAIARSYPPDIAHDARYSTAQERARAEARGLWASDACSAQTESLLADGSAVISIEIHEDAAGDDNINLNDEWVRFTNDGDEPVDMTGWTVKDESASNRYVFDSFVLEPGSSATPYTGCGTDGPTERYWCHTNSAVWNNNGDTVFLLDPNGNVVSSHSY